VTVSSSQITANTSTIYDDAEFDTFVGASLLSGGAVVPNGSTMTCAGVYDESFVFYPDTCP
jgi:hypothetical protein